MHHPKVLGLVALLSEGVTSVDVSSSSTLNDSLAQPAIVGPTIQAKVAILLYGQYLEFQGGWNTATRYGDGASIVGP